MMAIKQVEETHSPYLLFDLFSFSNGFMKRKNKILIGLLIVLVAAQAIQPSKNQGNPTGPKDIFSVLQVPTNVQQILKRSCYDCHSNQTTYPWYDNITPVNWWVAHHINEGKRELNFTEFGNYTVKRQSKKLDEVAETVESDEMPLNSYLIMHGDAKLSIDEKKLLIDWAKAAMNQVKQVPAP